MVLIAEKLSPLKERVVFVGGAILSLLIEDPASVPVRPTDDVDVIIDVPDAATYRVLETTLRQLGFKPDTSEGAPLCRWTVEDVVVDVMPASQTILGFTNRWYRDASAHAVTREIEGKTVLIAAAPYFLAMKLDAFLEALPGHLPGDRASQARVPIVLTRLRAITRATIED